MKKQIISIAIVVLCLVYSQDVFAAATSSMPNDPGVLKDSIDAKAKELQQINAQIANTQNNLDQTKTQGKSLQKDVQQLNLNINNLTLKIKADTLAIDKTRLEIEQLNIDIGDIKSAIASKHNDIGNTLRLLQQKDGEALIITIFKNGSLADSVLEAQNLQDLSSGLKTEINGLMDLNNNLSQKLDMSSDKLSGIQNENLNLKNRKAIVDDQKAEREKLLRLTKSQELAYNNQLLELDKRQGDIEKEIEQLEAELRKKINASGLPTARTGVLLFPAPDGRITQGYGKTTFALSTYKSGWHNGIDIGKALGAEIIAADEGMVVNVGNQDKFCPRGAYGKYIVVKHLNGLTTLYGHLSSQVVSVGNSVTRGQIIGYMGKTGWATGPHLHFSVFDSSTYTVNASRYCGPMPVGGDLNPNLYI